MKSEKERKVSLKHINIPSSPTQATQVADFYIYLQIAIDSRIKIILQ